MTNVPWSVKGIDRKARETAKDLARRSGLTLGEWLNQVIEYQGEDGGKATVTPLPQTANLNDSIERLTARIEGAETRSTLAITGIDQSVRGLAARLESAEREQAAGHALLAERLRKLEEGAGPEGLRALETSLSRISGQIHENEAAQKEILAKVRDELSGLAQRMDRLESGGVEAILADAERRLEKLAGDLTSRVEAVRAEIAAELPRPQLQRMDRMERTLLEVQQHMKEAERRSSGAIERMGHEVLRMADALSRQVKGVEARAADAIDKLGGDVARLADQLDVRLREADAAQAKALEKLGDEITRITERLSDRITHTERRAAQAFDRLNGLAEEPVSDEIAERMRKSEERTAQILEAGRARIEARIAERAAQRADEQAPGGAVDPDDFSPLAFAPAEPERAAAAESLAPAPVLYLDEADPRAEYAFAPPSFAPVGEVEDDPFAVDEDEFEPYAPPLAESARAPVEAAEDLADPFAAAELEPAAPFDAGEDPFTDDPFAVDDDLDAAQELSAPDAPLAMTADDDVFAEPAEDEVFAEDDFSPVAQEAYGEDLLVAEDAQHQAGDGGGEADEPPAPELLQPAALAGATPRAAERPMAPEALSRAEFIERARAAARNAAHDRGEAAVERDFGGFGRRGTRSKNILLMSTAALVCLGSGLVGVTVLAPRLKQDAPQNAAEPATAGPRAAMLTDPKPIGGAPSGATLAQPAAPAASAAAAASVDPAAPDAAALFAEATRLLDQKDRHAVDLMRQAANLGHPQAQLQLGRLYETGQLGLARNLTEARRWTQRAAEAGLPKAMHNLAMYYFNGEGGERSTAVAAQWFRQAADLGLTDSQYNLGLLYERGIGVLQNPAEAYKWFLIASRSGEPQARAEARAAALRVRPLLSAEAQLAAERSAGSYAPQPIKQAAR